VNAEAEAAYWSEPDRRLGDIVGLPPYDVAPVVDRIRSWIDCLRVLDLGCGYGRTTNVLARAVESHGIVHGVDIAQPLLDTAEADAKRAWLDNVHYWRGDGRRLPDELRGRFSGAYSITMFQHIPHEAMWGYLREVHDRLEPEGVFLFTIALGDIDMFLNHQIADRSQFVTDLAKIYRSITIEGDGRTGRTWIAAHKEGR
jgi:SAM-dependent methyltransferase